MFLFVNQVCEIWYLKIIWILSYSLVLAQQSTWRRLRQWAVQACAEPKHTPRRHRDARGNSVYEHLFCAST